MHYRPLNRNLLFIAVASACATAPVYGDNNEAALDNVTVIGEKTERSLKDTTSSVSVISEEELSSMKHLSISSAVSEVANVVVLSGSNPDIRGVSGNGSATGFNSFTGGSKARVSRLVDGVAQPFVADMTGDTGLWDIEQIEVFRGPQSTSNGRSSIAGSVYVKTKDPSFDWQGKARLGARNQKQLVDTAVMASGPLIKDELAFRIAAQRLDGDTYNKGTDHPTHAADFDLNELNSQRIRSKLLWKPAAADNFSALLSYSTAKEKGDAGREFFTGEDPWKFVPLTQRYMDTQADTVSLKLDYEINPNISVDLLAAAVDFKWGFDSYETDAKLNSQVRMKEDDSSLDAKVNFHNPDSMVNGFVGLAYSKREQKFRSTGGRLAYDGQDDSTSNAIYGEINVQATQKLAVVLGTRAEKDEQSRDFRARGQNARLDRNKTVHLPKLVLQYEIDDQTTIAFSSRKGYNQGGGALAFPSNEYYYFDEESVITHELSSRSSLNDGDLNISANLFHNNYTGYQAMSSSRRITNMDKAVSYGLELDIQARINSDLQLRSGLGLLETKIKDGGNDYPDAKNKRLNSAPGVTANIGSRYWFTHALDIDLSARYVGEYFGDFQNTIERKAGDYVVAKMKLSYEQGDWLISGFVNNLADKQARTVREPKGRSEAYASIIDPRTIGASVTYSF